MALSGSILLPHRASKHVCRVSTQISSTLYTYSGAVGYNPLSHDLLPSSILTHNSHLFMGLAGLEDALNKAYPRVLFGIAHRHKPQSGSKEGVGGLWMVGGSASPLLARWQTTEQHHCTEL
jgi:hypothetical protein